ISGDRPWIAADFVGVDGFSGATWLARATAEGPQSLGPIGSSQWWDAFIGLVPGSMGETSALLCLIGAAILIVTRIGSWRTMLGVVGGSAAMAVLLNVIGSETNPAFAIPFAWHAVLGGWAFGTVFMATDPVSSAFTDKGRLIYGFGIGVMVILVRVVNPAYPEGMMLAILFMNMFAPFIDHFFVQANIKRRLARNAAGQ
ncbi:MAG: RnfABCDGE type electron transport complex subunit D, partial [Thermoanaerobaculales bacterium]|nr:RnfABCDGE type electron transport complex subunit D [Thermoanaerobaculales bacterium]